MFDCLVLDCDLCSCPSLWTPLRKDLTPFHNICAENLTMFKRFLCPECSFVDRYTRVTCFCMCSPDCLQYPRKTVLNWLENWTGIEWLPSDCSRWNFCLYNERCRSSLGKRMDIEKAVVSPLVKPRWPFSINSVTV